MYELNDTIVAVSSPTSEQRVIIRISGAETVGILQHIFSPRILEKANGLTQGSVAVDAELKVDAKLYLFIAPHSYTGDDLAEIHIYTNQSVAESLMSRLLAKGLRVAGPGEFTARAYLNGKIDLSQAEAVNKVVTCSNRLQLAAAEKLLSGRLTETTSKVGSELLDCLSLIEAGLDFSDEDIEFITRPQAVKRLGLMENELKRLLCGSISYETVIDLPAVGIAGATNAGKSSLLNKLLGKGRSIVSDRRKTTRDVLTGLLKLPHCNCVLFDCAGLITEPEEPIDELAQQAAIEALNNAPIVIFCVDVSKKDLTEDLKIKKLIEPDVLIPLATKSDLLTKDVLANHLAELNELFAFDFFAVSSKTGAGMELLREVIDKKIIESALGGTERDTRYVSRDTLHGVALTARHKQAVEQAINSIGESIVELKAGSDEVAAMMLRTVYQAITNIESATGGHVDERILEMIFSRFCIGK
jgi:tRNA modification GTPase